MHKPGDGRGGDRVKRKRMPTGQGEGLRIKSEGGQRRGGAERDGEGRIHRASDLGFRTGRGAWTNSRAEMGFHRVRGGRQRPGEREGLARRVNEYAGSGIQGSRKKERDLESVKGMATLFLRRLSLLLEFPAPITSCQSHVT